MSEDEDQEEEVDMFRYLKTSLKIGLGVIETLEEEGVINTKTVEDMSGQFGDFVRPGGEVTMSEIKARTILNVKITATKEDMEKKWKWLCKINHPDLFQDEDDKKMAEEQMKLINQAYELLCKEDQ